MPGFRLSSSIGPQLGLSLVALGALLLENCGGEDLAKQGSGRQETSESGENGEARPSGGWSGVGGNTAPDGSGGLSGSGGRTSDGGGNTISSGGRSGTGGGNPGDSAEYYVSSLCFSAEENGWGPVERDLSNGEEAPGDGGPLTLKGRIFDRGLGVHAPSSISIDLNGACSEFSATVGVDDEMRKAGSIQFRVMNGDRVIAESPAIVGGMAPHLLSADVTGLDQIQLVADEDGNSGSDHGDWAQALLTCTAPPASDCTVEALPVPVPDGYQLAWSDEFNGSGPPLAENWSFEQGFTRNEELQWYQSENAWMQAGFLIIEGRREQKQNPNYQAGSSDWKINRQFADYTSSSIHSRDKQSFQYGRFEMRGRLIAEPGLWPAFWTLGQSGEWPSNGEIDILEYYGNSIHANVATGTNTRWEAKWDSVAVPMSSFEVDWDRRFHIWRMEWDAETIELSLDGEVLNTTKVDDMLNPGGDSPFRQPHYILINLAIGGTAGGSPAETDFPSKYEIDWVRVYQRN